MNINDRPGRTLYLGPLGIAVTQWAGILMVFIGNNMRIFGGLGWLVGGALLAILGTLIGVGVHAQCGTWHATSSVKVLLGLQVVGGLLIAGSAIVWIF